MAQDPERAAAELSTPRVSGWRREGWGSVRPLAHALALLLILGATWVRFPAAGASTTPLDDEQVYFEAFARVAEGKSPYSGGYYYPPIVAHLGAWSADQLGEGVSLVLLRGGNWLGLAVLVWASVAWLPQRWRLTSAVAIVIFSPCVALGVRWGNLSLVASAWVLLGLMGLESAGDRCRGRIAALGWGSLLGLSIAAKPIAAVVPVLLATGCRNELGRRRRFLGAALTAGATSAVLILPFPYLSAFLNQAQEPGAVHRSTSLARLLYLLGLEVDPILLLVAVAVAAALLLHRLRLGSLVFISAITSAALLASPIVWSHTLLLTLPTQLGALACALVRRRDSVTGRLPFELTLVVLGVLAIQLSEGVGGIDDSRRLAQVGAVFFPCLAPAALTAYLVWTRSRGLRLRDSPTSRGAGASPD